MSWCLEPYGLCFPLPSGLLLIRAYNIGKMQASISRSSQVIAEGWTLIDYLVKTHVLIWKSAVRKSNTTVAKIVSHVQFSLLCGFFCIVRFIGLWRVSPCVDLLASSNDAKSCNTALPQGPRFRMCTHLPCWQPADGYVPSRLPGAITNRS